MSRVTRFVLALVAVLAVPRVALACPVCFGASDSLAAMGMNNAILALLIVTVGVLSSFGAFFIYLMRRASAVHQSPAPARPVEQRGNG